MSLEEFVYVVNNVGVPLALLAMIIFAMFRFLPEYIKRQQEKEFPVSDPYSISSGR